MSAFGAVQGGPLDRAAIVRLVAHLRGWQTAPRIDVEAVQVDGDADAARPLYAERCASCHGEHGGGRTALSLSNPMFLMTASDGFIRHAIEHGRDGTPMPAFGDELEPKQLDDLTALVRSWARNVDDRPVGELPPNIERVVINAGGPAPRFPSLREGRYLPAAAVSKALAGGARMVLLDARPTSDWLRSHIPGALPVPYYDGIGRIIEALPRDDTWIIAYCGCPHAASGTVMDQLRAAGFRHTAVIDEGFFVWASRGYPLTHGSRPRDR
jgi:mono/diheme cytochrome c family protein/rhodanese-related sulfurtransferase